METMSTVVAGAERVTHRRYIIFGLLALMTLLNYLDRTVLSVAMPVLKEAFGLTPVQTGYLLSSFIWTYAIFMLPSGVLVDRLGTRRMAAGCLALWSSATALTGLANGYFALFAARLLLGVGEAPTFPVGARVVREWAPVRERGFAMSLLTSGITIGTAVGSLAIAWLVEVVGWRAAFVISGALGFIWLAAWLLVFRQPERASWLPAAERRMILASRGPEPDVASAVLGLRQLLGFRTIWGLFLTQGCANYTQYFLLTWLPTYLVQSRGTKLLASGFDLAFTYLGATVLILIIGRISDQLLNERSVAAGHRRYAVVVLLLMATAMAYAPFTESNTLLLMLIGLSVACVNSVFTMQWSLTNDLLRDTGSVGTAIAIVQMGGQVFGLAAPIVTGYLVAATGGFTGAFLLAGGLLLCGALTALTLTRQPITLSSLS
jgi:ACS family glucarate transporter-like MFS transporter